MYWVVKLLDAVVFYLVNKKLLVFCCLLIVFLSFNLVVVFWCGFVFLEWCVGFEIIYNKLFGFKCIAVMCIGDIDKNDFIVWL